MKRTIPKILFQYIFCCCLDNVEIGGMTGSPQLIESFCNYEKPVYYTLHTYTENKNFVIAESLPDKYTLKLLVRFKHFNSL